MAKSHLLATIPSLQQILVEEENLTTFALSHPKHVPLFRNPLESPSHDHQLNSDALLKGSPDSAQATGGDETPPSDHDEKHGKPMVFDPEEPVLRQAHEASTIQLFYDLFFVANLTTFTSVHEINDDETLRSYIGYFSILWFTWLQVGLFDVRFSTDSAFERLCKALQFGVMVGFAVVGPGYSTEIGSSSNPQAAEEAVKQQLQTFRTLTLILMASRLVLAGQYFVAYCWTKDYKKARLPLLAHVGTMLASAIIFLGVFWAFHLSNDNDVTIAWYVVIAVEASAVLLISGRTKFLGFRRTALVERLGLLTLIILGEGVIGLCDSIKTVRVANGFPPNVIGQIICAVLIIYFLWMLYFDQIETERVGTIRQQIWAMLHFPFHVSVLLVVEGVRQLSVFSKITDIVFPFQAQFTIDPTINEIFFSPYTLQLSVPAEAISNLNETLQGLIDTFPDSDFVAPDFSDNLNALGNATTSDGALTDAYYTALGWVFDNFEIKAPKKDEGVDAATAAYDTIDVFNTVFVYFFVCSGLTLILLAALFWLGKRRKSRGEFLSIALRIIVGLGLALLATMDAPSLTKSQGSAFNAFLYSSWLLPTVLLAYGLVIGLDNLLINYVRKALFYKSASHTQGQV